jgi:hypothetical protein
LFPRECAGAENLAIAINQRSYAKLHKIESGPDWSIEIGKN